MISLERTHFGITIWMTGLSGAGKSTIAQALQKSLCDLAYTNTIILDGDAIREHLSADLGFSAEDRLEQTRRVSSICQILNDQNFLVIAALISPLIEHRKVAREIIGKNKYFELYISTSLAECEKRDVKGLYHRALKDNIPLLTGVSSPYEPPENPWLTIDTSKTPLHDAIMKILQNIPIKVNV